MDKTLFLIIKFLNKSSGSTRVDMMRGMLEDPEFNYKISDPLLKRRIGILMDHKLVTTIPPHNPSRATQLIRYRLTLKGYSLVGKDIDSKAWTSLRADIQADCQSGREGK